MKQKINAAIAKASAQSFCAGDICGKHELAAIGVGYFQAVDLVTMLEADIPGRIICDDAWPSWRSVADIYNFYGVK